MGSGPPLSRGRVVSATPIRAHPPTNPRPGVGQRPHLRGARGRQSSAGSCGRLPALAPRRGPHQSRQPPSSLIRPALPPPCLSPRRGRTPPPVHPSPWSGERLRVPRPSLTPPDPPKGGGIKVRNIDIMLGLTLFMLIVIMSPACGNIYPFVPHSICIRSQFVLSLLR